MPATAQVYYPDGSRRTVQEDADFFSLDFLQTMVKHPEQDKRTSRIEVLPNSPHFRLKWLENKQDIPLDMVAYVNEEGQFYWDEDNGQIGYALTGFENYEPRGPVVLVEGKYVH